MDKQKAEEFREILEAQLESLLKEAGKTVSEMTDEKENFPDPTDRASMESDRNFELRIRDRERRLIGKIREALKRIDDGEFGFAKAVRRISPNPACAPALWRPCVLTVKRNRNAASVSAKPFLHQKRQGVNRAVFHRQSEHAPVAGVVLPLP